MHITDRREPGLQPPQHRRVRTPQHRPDPVRPPIRRVNLEILGNTDPFLHAVGSELDLLGSVE
ncbi:hypothetical protein [Streptomyces platensis]|uniref:hypothetical protein n=1 Tax=Streptomyces platensis TaxID=58346 RepID=UPI0038707613|nr:hypothetical protein OG962_33865 [Streptomyces platensis]